MLVELNPAVAIAPGTLGDVVVFRKPHPIPFAPTPQASSSSVPPEIITPMHPNQAHPVDPPHTRQACTAAPEGLASLFEDFINT